MLHLQVMAITMFPKKRIAKLLPFVFIYFLLSCHSKSYVAIPANILPPDSMTTILSEIHVLQASAQQGYTPNPKDTNFDEAYHSLLKKHHLTDSSYKQSMQFYCDHARLLDSVYEKVLSNLNQQKAELMGEKHIPGKQTK
jgi:hypothetical protein